MLGIEHYAYLISSDNIYHARPDEDDQSYVIYDEEEFGDGKASVDAKPPPHGSQGPGFGPPTNVSLIY